MAPEADRDMMDTLATMAANDGDAYRDGRNAKAAVECAFTAWQRSRRQTEREDFSLCQAALVKELRSDWRKGRNGR